MSRWSENASLPSWNSGSPASMSLMVLTLAGAPSLPVQALVLGFADLGRNIPLSELRILGAKFPKVVDNLPKQVFHVHVPVGYPYFVLLAKLNFSIFFIRL